jgi:hypothetical protein
MGFRDSRTVQIVVQIVVQIERSPGRTPIKHVYDRTGRRMETCCGSVVATLPGRRPLKGDYAGPLLHEPSVNR